MPKLIEKAYLVVHQFDDGGDTVTSPVGVSDSPDTAREEALRIVNDLNADAVESGADVEYMKEQDADEVVSVYHPKVAEWQSFSALEVVTIYLLPKL